MKIIGYGFLFTSCLIFVALFLMIIGWISEPEIDIALFIIFLLFAAAGRYTWKWGKVLIDKSMKIKAAPSSSILGKKSVYTPMAVSSSPANAMELKNALLNLNNKTIPFRVIEGHAENVDLIAEWKIADADWYEVFAKAGIKKVFKIYMKLHPEKRRVNAIDKEYTVSWSAGVPTLSLSAEFFRGQKWAWEFEKVWAIRKDFTPGEVYSYKFSTAEIKGPIKEIIKAHGWKYKGVAFGKL